MSKYTPPAVKARLLTSVKTKGTTLKPPLKSVSIILTLFKIGIKYKNEFVVALPNIVETPTAIITIISGVARPLASLMDFANALIKLINIIKIRIVESKTNKRATYVPKP